MKSNLPELISGIHPFLQEEVQRIFADVKNQASADDPLSDHILTQLESYCLRPGKGLRPMLVSLGAAAQQGKTVQECWSDPVVRRAMTIVSLKHKRLLLADDIADRDQLRNEEPAFHVMMETWMEQNAPYAELSPSNRAHFARSYSEVAGIWLQQIVTNQLITLSQDVPTQRWLQMTKDFDRYSYQVTIAGWLKLFDQALEPLDETVSRERLLQGLYQVTGGYSLTSPLLIGAGLGGDISHQLRACIVSLGEKAGTLYQLSDDWLGLFGDPAVTGKPVGGDIREGKKTLYIQEAFHRGDAASREKLVSLVGNPNITHKEVAWVQDFVKNSGALQAADAVIAQYLKDAQDLVSQWPDRATREVLEDLLVLISHREK